MNAPPTRDQVADAATVLGKASLYDPRMQSGDPAMAAAWAETFARHDLTLDDLLPAVVEHYATSRERIMPADVVRIARERRNTRLGAAPLDGPDRRRLEARADSKALPDELAQRRKTALAEAAAKIGNTHAVDGGTTFAAKPRPARVESAATRAQKVARARAEAPPAPMPPDDSEVG